jgi:mannose-6-phosphate isomerase-like protein (cupin superfamily)
MAEFRELIKKGLSACWMEASLNPDRLSLHLSQIEPGTRAHPPHTHTGVEAFYILEGSGVVELEDGTTLALSANQTAIIDAGKMHGLVNTGSVPMRYLVIISKP